MLPIAGCGAVILVTVTALIGWIIWQIIRDFLDPLNETPCAPDSHPLFKHLLVFLKNEDSDLVFRKWCEQFKERGIFHFNPLLGELNQHFQAS